MVDVRGDRIEVRVDKSCNGPEQLWSEMLDLMYESPELPS